jgi:hypothetical protein
MKIEKAKLCVNCEEVFSYSESRNGSCPVCGSSATIFVNQAWTRKNTLEMVSAGAHTYPEQRSEYTICERSKERPQLKRIFFNKRAQYVA